VFTTRRSNYNSDMIINRCCISGCTSSAEHTHHIRYQCEADDNGYVTASMHKNHVDNLVGICHKHHNDVHNGDGDQQLVIFGYHSGTRELDYRYRKRLQSLM
jgi:hypothetical protein